MAATDTIYALASGALPSAIAVIRLSGPGALAALAALAGRLPPARRASLCRLSDPATAEPLDDALCLALPAPGTATGEDMAELQVHGGRATVSAVLAALSSLPGLRPAGPGEFARRAFRNGRMDLAAVEGLADLVAADTEAQRRQALAHLHGQLGAAIHGWRDGLAEALALSEAALDFPDEDLPADLARRVRDRIDRVQVDITAVLAEGTRGEKLREGFRVALLGAPNAGKSSLLNALARRDAAIVSEEAGTTRDIIELELDLGGLPVILADTAGLRAVEADRMPGGRIEAEGMRRARAWGVAADLRLVLLDGSDGGGVLSDELADLLNGPGSVLVLTKADLWTGAGSTRGRGGLTVSAHSGAGLAELEAEISARAAAALGMAREPALFTRARHRDAAKVCIDALDRAISAPLPELAAEDLRLALRALGRVTGAVDVEELLDIVFRELCIGK